MKVLRVLLLLSIVGSAFLGSAYRAAAGGGVTLMQGETSLAIPAGGEVRVNVKMFCLEFGKDYPSALGIPQGRADDNVLRLLATAIANDDLSNPLVPQLAIWSARENKAPTALYPDHQITVLPQVQALQQKAGMAEVPAAHSDQGVMLDEAIASNQVTVTTENFETIDAPRVAPDDTPYHGQATLVIHNNSDEALQLYIPVGFFVNAPLDSEQDLVGYVTDAPQSAVPATMAETGAGAASAQLPLLTAAAGLFLLLGAGLLTARRPAR